MAQSIAQCIVSSCRTEPESLSLLQCNRTGSFWDICLAQPIRSLILSFICSESTRIQLLPLYDASPISYFDSGSIGNEAASCPLPADTQSRKEFGVGAGGTISHKHGLPRLPNSPIHPNHLLSVFSILLSSADPLASPARPHPPCVASLAPPLSASTPPRSSTGGGASPQPRPWLAP